MAPTSSAYQGMVISARSRRLRLIGGLLVVAILCMVLYGIRVLMPTLNKTVTLVAHSHVQAAPSGLPATPPGSEVAAAPLHLRHILRAQIIFAYGYWTLCSLFVLSLLLVAWLDLREVTRNYANQRRKLWTETAQGWSREQRPEVSLEDLNRTARVSTPGANASTGEDKSEPEEE